MEEAQAVPMVVAMDLEVEVVDMVAEGFKIKQKRLQFLAGERARSLGIPAEPLFRSPPESEALSGKLQVTLRQSSQMH